jgi:hypothetical protein
MNILKRATLVTFVAGSGILFAATGAAAATTVDDASGQSGVQGTSVENDRNSGEEGQIGFQGTSVENDRNSGEEGQLGVQGTSGDGANDQKGTEGQSGNSGA